MKPKWNAFQWFTVVNVATVWLGCLGLLIWIAADQLLGLHWGTRAIDFLVVLGLSVAGLVLGLLVLAAQRVI